MSTVVNILHRDLSSKIVLPTTSSPAGTPWTASESQDALRTYFLELNPPATLDEARKCIDALHSLEFIGAFTGGPEGEAEALRIAILQKLLLGLYIQTLDTFLHEASDAETELEWWSDIERSRLNSAYYLLQTLPSRLASIAGTIIRTVRSQNIPLHLSVFTPSSIRQLFPYRNILRPHTLTVALFPHLEHEPFPLALLTHPRATAPTPTALTTQRVSRRAATPSLHDRIQALCARVSQTCYTTVTLPLELSKHECTYKRKKLEEIRDERAPILGGLLGLQDDLASTLMTTNALDRFERLYEFVDKFRTALNVEKNMAGAESVGPLEFSHLLVDTVLPRHVSSHQVQVAQLGLRRPSRLTRMWPKLVFAPPLALFAARYLYHSRDSLAHLAQDAVQTLKGFWEDWLLGPLKDVVKTVRAGGDEGVIITKESVKADLESLERMAMSLAKEKLNYTAEQMAALSVQIRQGDLTAVMQIYEDDIRSPLKSAVGGTLLRTLLVQVQKAKVDIDQALAGIDKLLKSQELTFAFVGVAPALAIVYIAAGYARTVVSGSRGKGRYGGCKRRARIWNIMRRIERLLIAGPPAEQTQKPTQHGIDARTAGLLLLSTTHLRAYANTALHARSRLRDGFLEDVSDLEDPALGRREKLRVVDRMWNSYGNVLGWQTIVSE